MHHKFCVIDQETIITGSYNWSRRARINDENIIVVTDAPDLAGQYLETFHALREKAGGAPAPPTDTQAVCRRLELIRNLILLGELDDLGDQVRKLRPQARTGAVPAILEALERGAYRDALAAIDSFLQSAKALAPARQTETALLKLRLQGLEMRLDAITAERGELERRLAAFNYRHTEALGDLIQKIQMARVKLALCRARRARERPDAEDPERFYREAHEAHQQYRKYRKQQEAVLEEPAPPTLDTEAEGLLKRLYRKACSRCHPDKVSEAQKAQAHTLFKALQKATISTACGRSWRRWNRARPLRPAPRNWTRSTPCVPPSPNSNTVSAPNSMPCRRCAKTRPCA